jgi:hypothetical protein
MSAASLVQNLTEFAGEAGADYDDIDIPEDAAGTEVRAIILTAIRDCRADLAKLYAAVEADLIATSGNKRFVVDGLGEVAIRKNIKRTGWDNQALTAVVVARALDERIADEATGEYEPAHEAVARVLSDCARPSWRVTPLRARGVQVDEFCTESPDGWQVQLPPRAS